MTAEIVLTREKASDVVCDALIVGVFMTGEGVELGPGAREVDDVLDGYLSEYLSEAEFKAKAAQVSTVPTGGRIPAQAVVAAGLGKKATADASVVRRAAGSAARGLSRRRALASTLHQAVKDPAAPGASVEGFLLGSYRFASYKSDPRPSKIERVMLLGEAESDDIARAEARAEATRLARDLVNEPAHVATPEYLARKANEIADASGLECTVFDEAALADKGFGGILGVARGTDTPPRLILMRYRPEAPKGKVALVGKGVTFDSGGLSIKDAKNMETMKTDMAGAAAVIGAMSAVSRLGIEHEVVGIVPATENMPGGKAIKPGDVIHHYGGRTSEVLNTDAEGRLILADAVAFAGEERPDAIVDVATLTGGIMVALGKKATGLFSNSEELAAEILTAAERAGERTWHMPLYDDYRTALDSEIADIKNTGPRWGSAINGALFIRDFLAEDTTWAHLDIAGPARADSDYDEVVQGGTGAGTRTLLRFLEGRSD